jgi:hypothetical protein
LADAVMQILPNSVLLAFAYFKKRDLELLPLDERCSEGEHAD